MSDGVVFLPSFYEAVKDLPDSERLGVYDAVMRYGLFGEITELSPVGNALFLLMRPVIDSSQRRHRAAKANGAKGGAPEGNQNAKKTTEKQPKIEQEKERERERDIDSESDSETKPRSKRFRPPSLEEVAAYCKERASNVDPAHFVDYYEARGWKLGKNTMKSWKAAVRSWEARSQSNFNTGGSHNPFLDALRSEVEYESS